MTISVIKPKTPRGEGWQAKDLGAKRTGYPLTAWEHSSGVLCLSAVEVAHEPGKPDLGPEYHLSMSYRGGRCDRNMARWVLRQFGLTDAKEDNHVPGGIARNFWRPVADGLSGYECPCVDHEPTIREDRGDFEWRGVST